MINQTLFLNTIFGSKGPDENVLVAEQLPTGGFRNVEGFGREHASWIKSGRGRALYANVSTVVSQPNGSMLRRRTSDTLKTYLVALDDVGTKVPEDKIKLPPTYELLTSEGNKQVGYKLTTPTTDKATYEAFLRVLGKAGLTDEGMIGVTRLIRIPGSVNLKPKRNNFVSTVTSWNPEITYSLDELIEAFGFQKDKLDIRPLVNETIQANLITSDLIVEDEVLIWARDNNKILQYTDGEWVSCLCPWHTEHTDGRKDAAYSPLARGEGHWSLTRNFKCQHAHCHDKSYGDLIEVWAEEGCPVAPGFDPLTVAQARYAYVGEEKKVADLLQREKGGLWLWDLEAWSNMNMVRIWYGTHPRPILLKTAFLESSKTKKAARVTYLPGADPIAEEYGQTIINTYISPNHAETSEVPDVFLDHVAYLLPDYREMVWFLDWLAYKIQNPSKRSCAVIMVADSIFGIGRSWLGHFLKKVLQGHVNKATLDQLIGKGTLADQNYNDWAQGCQFIICDEAKDVSAEAFFSAYEVLKQRVDTSPVTFRSNTKYGKTQMATMFWNALIFSNHADCVIIPEDDRRIAVLSNPTEKQTPEYYDRLHSTLENDKEARRAFWYLKNRDVSGFNPALPLMTDAKATMIRASKSPDEEIMEWLVDNMEGDLVSRKNLKTQVVRGARALGLDHVEHSPGSTIRRIWRKMGSLLPANRNGLRVMIDTNRDEIRAIRNQQEWKKVDPIEDREKLISEIRKNSGDVLAFAGVA